MATGKSGNKNWRGERRGASGRSPSAQEATPGFMRRRDRSLEETNRAHRRKMALWGTVFLGLVAGLIVVLLNWRERPPLVIATVTKYDYPLPPNSWTEEDQELLMKLDGQSLVTCKREQQDGSGEVADYNAQWSGLGDDAEAKEKAAFSILEKKLRAAEKRAGGPNKDVVMMYVNMHGAVRGDGEPCLIPPSPPGPLGRTFAYNSSNWFSAKTLLRTLFKEKTDPRLKYVVFFDCSRVDSDWNLGWLDAGFPQRLGESLHQLALECSPAFDNVYVITSTSAGQVSWTAPELKGSVFGHFLYHGLQGWANRKAGWSWGPNVTLGELFRYLNVMVSNYVENHRHDEQTPMLFGKDGPIDVDKFPNDFALLYVPWYRTDDRPQGDEIAKEMEAAFQKHKAGFSDAWEKHKKLHEEGAWRRSPLKWQEYQHRLLYLEQLALAGTVGEREMNDQFAKVGELAVELERPDREAGWPGYSLPQAMPRRKKSLQPTTADAKPQAPAPTATDAKPPATPLDVAAVKPANSAAEKRPDKPANQPASGLVGDPRASLPAKPPGDSTANPAAGGTKTDGSVVAKPPAGTGQGADYLSAAGSLWQHFASSDASAEDYFKPLNDLPSLSGERKADLIEMHFLRMLKAYRGQASPADVRLAVQTRKLAEEAAWPGDRRAQYAIHGAVQHADSSRRLAEDRLFAGESYAGKEAELSYAAAKVTAEEVADAFRVRDEALTEITGYARWLLHRGRREADLEGTLGALITKSNAFSISLDQTLQDISDAPAADRGWPPEIIAAKSKIAELLRILSEAFENECSRLDKRPEGFSKDNNFEQLGAVLGVALEGAQSLESDSRRNRLREYYDDILVATAAEVAGESLEINADKIRDRTPLRAKSTGDPRALALPGTVGPPWKTHPALLIAGIPAAAPQDGLAAQGEQLRSHLKNILSAWFGPDAPAAASMTRSKYVEGDRLSRSVAGLWAGRDLPSVDFSAELRHIDRRNLLLWQAERTLADFWGPTPGHSQPYFQIVADEYLKEAGKLTPPGPMVKDLEARIAAVDARADEVKTNGVVRLTVPAETEIPPGARQVQINLDVSRGTLGLLDPGGEAALFFEDQARSTEDQPQHALATRDRSDSQEILRRPITEAKLNASGGSLALHPYLELGESALKQKLPAVAWTLYRGHVQKNLVPFDRPPPGLETVVSRPKREPPKLKVEGDAVRKTSIIFIFDCSGSMSTPNAAGKIRIDWAREQLNQIFEGLAKKPDRYRVGLLAYGSRYGYEDNTPNDRSKKWEHVLEWSAGKRVLMGAAKAQAQNADPDVDYQELLGVANGHLALKDFGAGQRALAESKLKELRPTSETPLYYTVVKAINLLDEDKNNKWPKRIVVITDGVNEQTPLAEVKDQTKRSDVKDALEKAKQGMDVRLDVIAIDTADQNRPEWADLKGLVEDDQKPRGRFIVGNNPGDLLKALERTVQTEELVLRKGDRKIAELELAKPIPLELPPDGKFETYSISVTDVDSASPKAATTFQVWGDEFVRLRYLDERQAGVPRLVYARTPFEDDGAHRDYAQVSDGDPRAGAPQYDVKAEKGKKDNGSVLFSVLIQNRNVAEFSYRPKSVWAEIVPVLPDGQEGRRYTFHDLCFAAASEPTLTFQAAEWPEAAATARIKLWFKFTATDADEELRLNDGRWTNIDDPGGWKKVFKLHNKEDSPEKTILLKMKKGEGNEGDPSYSIIVEQTVPSEMDLHTYKIDLRPPPNSPGSVPDEIRCRSQPSSKPGRPGKVTQTFTFNRARLRDVDIDAYTICVTAKKEIQKNACKPDHELLVDVE
jgi:hypothetical protein